MPFWRPLVIFFGASPNCNLMFRFAFHGNKVVHTLAVGWGEGWKLREGEGGSGQSLLHLAAACENLTNVATTDRFGSDQLQLPCTQREIFKV